ncbi:MAG: segregation/condensation protein A [Saprospiraceae bacterium]
MQQQNANYTIKIAQFEGPFDLLLFFIERDEVDILDIPISEITKNFLEYIRQLDELNIDVASEFILVAATLMRIKAKMLLPRKELDEEGNEIDPRMEIAQKLIEYKRFKSTLEQFRSKEFDRSLLMERGNISHELSIIAQGAMIDSELESLSLFKLLQKFQQVLLKQERRNKKLEHSIIDYPYSVPDQEEYITRLISSRTEVSFEDVFEKLENIFHAIITFLAMLELLNAEKLEILVGQNINQLTLKMRE